VTLNWAKNSNKVVELAKGIESLRTSSFNYPMYQEARIGEPAGAFVTFPYLRDDNGNKVIDGSGYPIRDSNPAVVGNATPDWIGGIVNNFSWKGLYVNFLIDMKMGGDIFSFTNYYGVGSGKMVQSLPFRNEEHGGYAYYEDDNGVYQVLPTHSSSAPNGSEVFHDGIIIEGVTESGQPNTQVMSAEVYYIDAYYWNYGFHEEGLFDNSYVKFREASIGYTFPKSLIGDKIFQNLTVSLIGRNLFYIYKSIPNIDPESSIGTNRETAAQEYGAYPSTRSYGFSIRAGF
jgi:iron complex outermembrane receptor protein